MQANRSYDKVAVATHNEESSKQYIAPPRQICIAYG
jgi:hypothetical protein